MDMRIAKLVGVAALVAGLTSGCGWTGLNSVSLPFTKGRGADDLTITVQLANAANLVPNSEVKYDEVTIGSVRKIELKDWTATLTVGIEKGNQIPADVTAKVAQKSLLGAEYLALADPTPTGTAQGPFLQSGDLIGLARTGRYPETEEVLSAASMLLNGGGLAQVRTITHELNSALTGRTQDVKSFMTTVSTFTARLDRQRDNIAETLHQLDRLSRDVVNDRSKVENALTELPQGFRLLESERQQLVTTLRSIDDFGRVAHRVIGSTKVGLQRNLANLRPVTKAIAAHGKELADSFDALSYPFNTRAANRVVFGDYMNLITTIEVSAGHLTRDWLGGTPLDGLFTGFVSGTPTGPAAQATDPLSGDPLAGLPGLPELPGVELPGTTTPPSVGTPLPTPSLDDLVDPTLGGL
jgi:phospholipid/cholesterol/gamma-HCH transport system substrate-binding protein